jgi:hypothetical protein
MSLTHHKIAATFCDRKRSLRSSGLVALIGVISAGMLLQGPAAGADLDPAWRVAVIAQSVASLSAAVYALISGSPPWVVTALDSRDEMARLGRPIPPDLADVAPVSSFVSAQLEG